MKVGVVLYHKNASKLYPIEWVQRCVDSIALQTFKNYSVYELNYGAGHDWIFTFFPNNIDVWHERVPLSNYAEAMNYVYEWAIADGCDIIANVNIDDYYSPKRLELLLESINNGADIASSNYACFDDDGIKRVTEFDNLDIERELFMNNNIVSNPCHIMRKEVFEKIKFNPTLVPVEDLAYWKECISSGFKIEIRKEILHYYRLHPNQSGNFK